LNELDIDYINAKASFKDANSVKFSYKGLFDKEESEYEIKGKNFLIATGGRPRQHPAIPQELSITSDDLFSLEKDPGTTLVVGGGYIAVECAGFLNGLGKEVYLANRSTFLRAMDTDMANYIVDEMKADGVKTMT
jgi:thioredoxin reductase (NADPH)